MAGGQTFWSPALLRSDRWIGPHSFSGTRAKHVRRPPKDASCPSAGNWRTGINDGTNARLEGALAFLIASCSLQRELAPPGLKAETWNLPSPEVRGKIFTQQLQGGHISVTGAQIFWLAVTSKVINT